MNKKAAPRFSLFALAALLALPARAEVVIIVSANSSLAPAITQVCQAFLGRIKTPTPVNFSEKSPLRDEFYSKACKKDPAQVQSIWGKLIFTGTGTPPSEVDSASAMKKLIAADPNSVGYIDRKDVDASVKVVGTVS